MTTIEDIIDIIDNAVTNNIGYDLITSSNQVYELLETKQNKLTITTPLIGTGEMIINLDYNNINNPPDLSTKQNL